MFFSPPALNFGPKQYVDDSGNVREDAEFDGDPTFKRRHLEKHRPPGWWTEWLKTWDMRKEGQDPKLIRGRRIRFFGLIEDIVLEEVISRIVSTCITQLNEERILFRKPMT